MSQKRKSSLSLYAIVLVVILVFSSCAAFAEAESSPDPIRIAFLYSLSGSNAESGQMCLDGASLAVEHVNANGGIKSLGGAPLELVVFDATSDPAQAKRC